VTPRAVTQILEYWLGTEDEDRFRTSLPILGVDGSLGGFCTSCPARGSVFAKTGTVAGPDDLNERLQIGAMTLGGYLEVGDGRYEVRAEAKSSDGHLTSVDVTVRRLRHDAPRRRLVGGRTAGSL
jgi:hypothetical protein